MPIARLEQIWIKRAKRNVMDAAVAAELVAARGIVGCANQGGKRQVTLIEREIWDDIMQRLGGKLPTSARRANLVVSGLPLFRTRGKVLVIHSAAGECRLRILGETKPCERMDETLPGLQAALCDGWRGGAFAEVITGGTISIGAELGWEQAPSVQPDPVQAGAQSVRSTGKPEQAHS